MNVVPIDSELHRRFKVYCAERRIPIKRMIEALIVDRLNVQKTKNSEESSEACKTNLRE